MSILNPRETAKTNNLGQLYGALARARGEFPDIPRNRVATVRMKQGGQYSFRYADLQDVVSATAPVLAAYGITVSQWPDGDKLKTLIGHESGAHMVLDWPIKALPQRGLEDAQSFQSAMQMAKRYAMNAALGISTEESIEGDEKAHKTIHQGKNNLAPKDPWNEEDGIRAPIGAKVNAKMTPRQIAEESARAIEALLDEPKTAQGLNGVWNRNDAFIAAFQERHEDLFQNIFDKFHERMSALEEVA